MVNTGILYAITAGVSAVTIYVIINRITHTEHKELIDKKLIRLMCFLCVFCVIDMLWGLLSSRLIINDQILYAVFTYTFHFGAALSAFLWAGYAIHYLKVDDKYKTILNCCRFVVLFVQLTVLISNIWTRNFFYVDSEAYYHSYELRNFMFIMQFLYYIALFCSHILRLQLIRVRWIPIPTDVIIRHLHSPAFPLLSVSDRCSGRMRQCIHWDSCLLRF